MYLSMYTYMYASTYFFQFFLFLFVASLCMHVSMYTCMYLSTYFGSQSTYVCEYAFWLFTLLLSLSFLIYLWASRAPTDWHVRCRWRREKKNTCGRHPPRRADTSAVSEGGGVIIRKRVRQIHTCVCVCVCVCVCDTHSHKSVQSDNVCMCVYVCVCKARLGTH